MEQVIDYIGKDKLDEAIKMLEAISMGIDDIYKELILLKSQLCDINKRYQQGIIREEDMNVAKNRIRQNLINLTFQLKSQADKIESTRLEVDKIPYASFLEKFREIAAPYYIASSKSYLHIVFGNISDIEHMSIAVGCSQDFDMYQSNPKSALGSLWKLKVGNRSVLEEVNEIWKPSERPQKAGLGTSQFIKLPNNTNNLDGIIFTVTTRDISSNVHEKGLYTNTPVEGIPIVLTGVFAEAQQKNMNSLALPLLGAGFANIAKTYNNPKLRFELEKAILAITIDESINQLMGNNGNLQRIIIVIFSDNPQSERENELWRLAIKIRQASSEKRTKLIDELINKLV